MARPEDLERAKAYLQSQQKRINPIEHYSGGPILIKKARELQHARIDTILALKKGDAEPLKQYYDMLVLFKAYLHLGDNTEQYEQMKFLLGAVTSAPIEKMIDVLTEQEEEIEYICKGATGTGTR